MLLSSALVERVALRVTLATPIFVALLSLAVQAELIILPMRELTLLAIAACGLWCICVPRMPSMTHLLLFASGIVFSGLAFALWLRGYSDHAPLLLLAPQALLFGASFQYATEDLREGA